MGKSQSYRKKFLVIIFRIILVLVLLEAGLRLSGLAFVAQQGFANDIGDEDSYKVLILGDSISNDLKNSQGTWPQALEQELNNRSKNLRFDVINKARAGATTNDVANNIEEQLTRHNPQAVIVMIGMNDEVELVERTDTSNANKFVSEFRVYGFARWFVSSLIKQNEAVNVENLTIKDAQQSIAVLEQQNESKTYERRETQLLELLKLNKSNVSVLFDLIEHYYVHNESDKLTNSIERLIDDGNKVNSLVFKSFGTMLYQLQEARKAEETLKKSLTLNPRDADTYLILATLYNE